MFPTRRLWATLALAAFLAVLAVATADVLLLGGAALVGVWVLVRQYRFVHAVTETSETLAIEQSVAHSSARTGASVPLTLAATRDTATHLELTVEAGLPTGATVDADDPVAITLEPGETQAQLTADVDWPVAGTHRFDEATVTVSDGFARETLTVGDAPTVTVEPRAPRTIHVGEGGDRTTAYGDHNAGRLGSGLEPAELREYVPSDKADRIDWHATARLATLHVREYESETDNRTMLVVDHRSVLATGPTGETKLDYLRDVVLALVANARRLGDPTGLITVGDEGITFRLEPATTPTNYARIRRQLLDLESTDEPGSPRSTTQLADRLTADDALAKRTALEGDRDPFATTLQPFYARRDGYRERIKSEPLYAGVRTAQRYMTETGMTVIVTDDQNPAELRETVQLARRNTGAVLVLLAPTVLYESGTLADAERAYERYVEFEQLRRDLSRLSGVTALEVGPQDRLETVLSAGRTRARGGTA